jgi:hypothetical protein
LPISIIIIIFIVENQRFRAFFSFCEPKILLYFRLIFDLAKELFPEEKKRHFEEKAKEKHENNIKNRIKNEENTN